MSEHQKQTTFLKTLLTYNDSKEHFALQERIAEAEREEKCLRHACKLVVVLGMFAAAGVGYCFVLLPGFFEHSRHSLVLAFAALALGCLIALSIFAGLWLWNRAKLHHLHDECRKLITSLVQSSLKNLSPTSTTVLIQEAEVAVFEVKTESATPDSETEIITLRKAS